LPFITPTTTPRITPEVTSLASVACADSDLTVTRPEVEASVERRTRSPTKRGTVSPAAKLINGKTCV